MWGRNTEFMLQKDDSHSTYCACNRLCAFGTNFYSVQTIRRSTIYYSVFYQSIKSPTICFTSVRLLLTIHRTLDLTVMKYVYLFNSEIMSTKKPIHR